MEWPTIRQPTGTKASYFSSPFISMQDSTHLPVERFYHCYSRVGVVQLTQGASTTKFLDATDLEINFAA